MKPLRLLSRAARRPLLRAGARRLRRGRRGAHDHERRLVAGGSPADSGGEIQRNEENSARHAHHRLEELHRAEGARRDLRAGPRGRRLHRRDRAQPRRRATALAALKGGDIDAYPEYTGTALLSFFDKQADELPKDPQAAYEEAKAGFEADGIIALPPTPFTSSNEVAVTQQTADELELTTISDLDGKSQDLTLYGSPECRRRLDCLLGLQEVYGLEFKKFTPVDIAQRHEVLTSGRADVSIVFTTDPQIQREKEVLLEDDQGMFPPYNSTLVMRQETADEAGPDLAKTVELLQEQLTDENMQELNARVDLDKKDPATVAGEYLSETGLVASE